MRYLSSLLSKSIDSSLVILQACKNRTDSAHRVTKSYPDIDCVFLNAGMQRNHDFSKPESVDLKAYFAEFDVNYKSMVILTHTFLPFLESQKTQTSLIL